MDISLIIICSGFLCAYSLSVISDVIEKLYNISCDIDDRKQAEEDKRKEEEDKNKISESVKHLFS